MKRIVGRFQSSTGRALVGTTIGSGPGLLLPFAITWSFSAGAETDAYFLAYAGVTFVLSLAIGVFEPNAMRLFGRRLHVETTEFVQSASSVALRGALISGVAFALIGGLLTLFTALATDVDTSLLAECLVAFLPLAAAAGASSVLAGAHYVADSYGVATATIAFRSLAGLLGLAIASVLGAGLVVVATASGAGEVARIVYLRARLQNGWRASGDLVDVATTVNIQREMWRPAGPHAVAMMVVATVPVIDRGVAATLGSGAVTIVDLAEKLYYIPNTILFSSLVLVTTARWAEAAGKNGGRVPDDFAARTWKLTKLSLMMSVAAAGALLLSSFFLPRSVSGVQTETLAVAASIAMFDLAPALVVALGGRLLAVLEKGIVLLRFSVVAVPLNAVTDVAGAALLGVKGVLLATVVSRTLLAGALAFYLLRLQRADRANV